MRSRFTPWIAGLVTTAIVGVGAACSDAGGNASGGDFVFDAAAPKAVDAQPIPGGDTWAELYRDYFGMNGAASCSGDPDRGIMGCHATDNDTGTKSSYFKCGMSADECWQGMTNQNSIVPFVGGVAEYQSDPTRTLLYRALRKVTIPPDPGVKAMPNTTGGFSFTDDDLKRVTDWIHEGALEN
jgi:hypothetical protein